MDGPFMFATSMRDMALGFIRYENPGKEIEDTPESAGPLLDLVQADVIRIQDPKFHQPCQVVPGMKWDESLRDEVIAICLRLLPHRGAK